MLQLQSENGFKVNLSPFCFSEANFECVSHDLSQFLFYKNNSVILNKYFSMYMHLYVYSPHLVFFEKSISFIKANASLIFATIIQVFLSTVQWLKNNKLYICIQFYFPKHATHIT